MPTSTSPHPIADRLNGSTSLPPSLPSHTYPSLRIQFRNELLHYQEHHLSLRARWWRAVSLYAFAKWRTAYKGHPVGIPGERDPLYPCSAYQPRPRRPGEQATCATDHHYLCHNCVENMHTSHRRPPVAEHD